MDLTAKYLLVGAMRERVSKKGVLGTLDANFSTPDKGMAVGLLSVVENATGPSITHTRLGFQRTKSCSYMLSKATSRQRTVAIAREPLRNNLLSHGTKNKRRWTAAQNARS